MEITIYDHQIVAVNRSKAENEANSIVYKDVMDLHNIDFEICAKNFLSEYPMSGGRCIGERAARADRSGTASANEIFYENAFPSKERRYFTCIMQLMEVAYVLGIC